MDSTLAGISNVVDPAALEQMSPEDQATIKALELKESEPAGGSLGKDEFLKLLVTQLSYQDPLDPMDSTESIAQLAQFSALEQMQNVGDQIASLRRASGMTDAMLLQGQNIEAVSANGTIYSGTVDRAVWGENGLVLTIGGVSVPMSSLVEMKLVPAVEPEATEETEADTETLSDTVEEAT